MLDTLDKPAPAASVLNFQVSGELLTDHAREFVQIGKWRKGHSFLKRSLIGITDQQALEILQGLKKLTGINSVAFEDDDAQALVTSWLDLQYGNCFTYRERHYRPYGFVTAFDREDQRLAQQIVDGFDPEMARNSLWNGAAKDLGREIRPSSYDRWAGFKYRPALYARNRSSDICFVQELEGHGEQPILCERVDLDLPLWYEVSKNASRAVSNALKTRRLADLYRDMHEFDADVPENFVSAAPPVQIEPPPSPEQEAQEKERVMGHIEVLHLQITAETNADTEFGWREASRYDKEAGRNVTIRVPQRALICAALHRANAFHLMPEYFPRCPQGLKMYGDDRFHSDAWIGAGFSPDTAYDQDMPEQRLFMSEMWGIQREKLKFPFDILARGKENYVTGEVIHDPQLADTDKILVVHSASPEYAYAAVRCKAVIVETGSKLAHLVIVSREEGIPVLRTDSAVETFKAGTTLAIDLVNGTLVLMPY
jgi:phosphohistidine swiveling domain-containing protein